MANQAKFVEKLPNVAEVLFIEIVKKTAMNTYWVVGSRAAELTSQIYQMSKSDAL